VSQPRDARGRFTSATRASQERRSTITKAFEGADVDNGTMLRALASIDAHLRETELLDVLAEIALEAPAYPDLGDRLGDDARMAHLQTLWAASVHANVEAMRRGARPPVPLTQLIALDVRLAAGDVGDWRPESAQRIAAVLAAAPATEIESGP